MSLPHQDFIGNDTEFERIDSRIDERTLRELISATSSRNVAVRLPVDH